MRLLVLGGTVFLSREVVLEALRRGHEVVCACRGTSGTVPEGAVHVPWDRNHAPPAELSESYDAVIDVARLPSHVDRAVRATSAAHWVFVSSISVYADQSKVGGPDSLELHDAITEDVDLAVRPEAYGPMKVGCEELVTAHASTATIVRPGLIVGPGDPTGRFTYWPHRLDGGGQVLAPGRPSDVVQVVDVRDLAAWLVTLAEDRTTGVLDVTGPPVAFEEMLQAGGAISDQLTWLDHDVLAERGAQPWMGPDSVPMWLPRPDFDGMMRHDVAPAEAAGLALRPLAETFAATREWLATDPHAVLTGISREREAELLAAAP